MKIIALRGNEISGKTTVIDIVYHFLIRDGYRQVTGQFRPIESSGTPGYVDCLTWNNIKLGISNSGNFNKRKGGLQGLIKEFEALKCNMMIIDCLYNSQNANFLENYKNHSFVEKTECKDISLVHFVNVADAEEIIKRLYYTINVWKDFA